MSDFNVDIDNSHINRQYCMLKLNFIQQLAALNLYDSYNLVHKDTISKEHTTWSHPSQDLHSRIDYIWSAIYLLLFTKNLSLSE